MIRTLPYWQRAALFIVVMLIVSYGLHFFRGETDLFSAKDISLSLFFGLVMAWWMPRMLK